MNRSLNLLVLFLISTSCSQNNEVPTDPADTTPPKAVSIGAGIPRETKITISFQAPGDDEDRGGRASQYDIRYTSKRNLPWSSMSRAANLPEPNTPGTLEMIEVSGLQGETTYFFQMKTADEVPNWSAPSNVDSATTLCIGADHWETLGHIYTGTMVSAVEWNGQLIVGGLFNEINAKGITVRADNIAGWDGAAWYPLGSGIVGYDALNPVVRGLIVFEGKLVATGRFHTAGGNPAPGIAVWNGVGWSTLGSAVADLFYDSPAADGQSLYVIGRDLDGYSGDVYAYDGSQWTLLSNPGLDARCLAVFNGDLVVAGYKGLGYNQVVKRWDGTSWQPLGSGADGSVSGVVIYQGMLIAIGTFTNIDGADASYVASWDGSHWSAMPGFPIPATAVAVHNNDLLVYGQEGGGPPTTWYFLRWDGSRWVDDLGCTTTNFIYSTGTDLYIGKTHCQRWSDSPLVVQ